MYGFYALENPIQPTEPSAQASEAPNAEQAILPWPATVRDGFVQVNKDATGLVLTTDDHTQLKQLQWQELVKTAATTEIQKLHSKSGWMFQGHWTTMGFQRLLTRLNNVDKYHTAVITTFCGKRYTIPKSRLNQFRIILKCEDKPIPALYGGPIMIHCFDNYVEFAIGQVKEICLSVADEPLVLPNAENGFAVTAMRVQTGNYYLINKQQIKQLRY